ncbi:10963_t:CDS:2, partial [Acaulospora morrowiae]
MQLHEEEIFKILPPSAIGIGITFVKSYREPSIIVYGNMLPVELTEQTIKNFFEVIQRPPEDIVICQLFDNDALCKPDNDSARVISNIHEISKGKKNNNDDDNFETEKDEYTEESVLDGNKGENDSSENELNGSKGENNGSNDLNGNQKNNDPNKNQKSNNKENEKDSGSNKNNGQEKDGGDGGDDPNDLNTVIPYGAIDANAFAKIMISDQCQEASIHFVLKMWHPGNDDELAFEISDIKLSGGKMLSKKIKGLKGEGYYPIKAEVKLEAHPEDPKNNLSILITSIRDCSPCSEMNVNQGRSKTTKISSLTGATGIIPAATLNLNQEKTISENVYSVSITNSDRGPTKILWEHEMENKEKKIPDYSNVREHKAHFKYAKHSTKNPVKNFEIKTELTLEYDKNFVSGLINYFHSRVIKFPAKLRFSLSIVIAENQIQNIFGKNDLIDCSHSEALRSSGDNNFEDCSRR